MKEIDRLIEYTKDKLQAGVVVAFSGGVDSSLLLKILSMNQKENGGRLLAVTFQTTLHPSTDLSISKKVAHECGVDLKVLYLNEFSNPKIMANGKDRCYQCKKNLFSKLKEFAESKSYKYIFDGSNDDDRYVYRPGMRALKELGIESPLLECGFGKKEIRKMAESLSLSVASRPSAPCLATRLPYGQKIEESVLKMIDEGENFLKSLGFSVVRIRLHDKITRIEIEKDKFLDFIDKKDKIISFLKSLGFLYVCLDLEGFRSGSMDIEIKDK